MLFLEDIPDNTTNMIIKIKTADGKKGTIRASEDILNRMRRETNKERIKRYCKVIEQLADDI